MTTSDLIKLLFGDVPIRGALRAIVIGAVLATCFFIIKDWKEGFEERVQAEATAVRSIMATSIAANDAWKAATEADQARFKRRVEARIRRLYERNGWVYEEIDP